MSLRWFGSGQKDEIDNLFTGMAHADFELLRAFFFVCGLSGIVAWFDGGRFWNGCERGIPLAAVVMIYIAKVDIMRLQYELRARLIEIDGKVSILEAAHITETRSAANEN